METPTEEEMLRLVKIFCEIALPEQRAEVFRLAEKYANQTNGNQKSTRRKDGF